MPANEFLPFGTGNTASVINQATYEALAKRLTGFQSGIALSTEMNKILRQGTWGTSALGQFIMGQLDESVLDNGDMAAFVDQLERAIQAAAAGGTSLVNKSALLLRKSNQNITLNAHNYVEWELEGFDQIGAFNPLAPKRLTVGPGINKVRLTAQAGVEFDNRAQSVQIRIVRNGKLSENVPEVWGTARCGWWNGYQVDLGYYGGITLNATSPIIEVAEGDYFEVWVYVSSTVNGIYASIGDTTVYNLNWFSMAVVE